jgi:hypothetical protein
MIETLFAAALAVSIAVFVYLRVRDLPPPRQAMFRGLLELTVPLTLTSGLFAALQWWVRAQASSVTAATTIREIERTIRTIRNGYIERLVIPAWAQLAILIAFIAACAIWPQVRRSTALGHFKTGTRWMTRVQIAATLMASFTFFGAVQATNARKAQVRLGEDIASIERAYDGAFAAADDVLAQAAVKELLSDPAWNPALELLAETIANQQAATHEVSLARSEVTSLPNSHLREFRVAAEQIPSAEERATFLRRDRPPTLPRRETWSRAQADTLTSDVETVRRETVTALVEAAADTAREAMAKRLIAEYFAGSAAEGFAAVVLDASVFYDFRHVVAAATASLVERVLGRGERLHTAFASVLPNLRNGAKALTPRAVETARQTYAARVDTSRMKLAASQQVHRDTLQEYRRAADAQAEREQAKLFERLTAKFDHELSFAARSLLERLIGPHEPAMTRIARIRQLERDVPWQSATVAVLVEKERELGRTEFNKLVEWRVDRLLRTERYSPILSSTMSFPDFDTYELWEKDKRAFVMQKLSEGATTITPREWDMAVTSFKASPKVVKIVEARRAKAKAAKARRGK